MSTKRPAPEDPVAAAQTQAEAAQAQLAPALQDAEVYDPPQTDYVIAGESFTLGRLTPRRTWRVARKVTAAYSRRGLEIQRIAQLPEEERAAALVQINIFDLFDEDDLLDVVALALSTPERPVTPEWIDAQCAPAIALQILEDFAQQYALGKLVVQAAGAVMTLMGGQMAPTPTPNGHTPASGPSSSN
jgi:hypothetical protein